jgi:hypothetical protein
MCPFNICMRWFLSTVISNRPVITLFFVYLVLFCSLLRGGALRWLVIGRRLDISTGFPLCLGLPWILVFELISVNKPSLHAFLSFFDRFSVVSSSNLVKRLLYLIDAKCQRTCPRDQNPLGVVLLLD